ncbi:hypothetical protein WJX81_003480 [Elliptochloris bilobata]|uniref:Uncharacterized protein n=1 Tax=Elliptochloris bilobata TaxID=381761 RepID=A0AAW1SL19_9CHLO
MAACGVAPCYAGACVSPRAQHRQFCRPFAKPAARSRCTGTRQRCGLIVRAQDDVKDTIRGAVRSGDKLADSAAGLIPAAVPRPAAKLAVLAFGGLVAFWVLQRVLSTAFFFLALGGAAYLWVKLSSRGGGSGGGGSGGDGSDPLSEASRIMDKYK